MEVILLERVGRLGAIGDVVRVKNGFARNFLLPMKKALRASDENKKVFETRRSEIEAKNAAGRAEAEARAKKLEGIALSLTRQASEDGKLFGSVTVRDIAEALAAQGHDVPKSLIVISGTIKTTGTYPIKVQLHSEVTVTLDVAVVRHELAEAAE